MGFVNWFRALFTIDIRNIDLPWKESLIIYLWRFFVMGYLAKVTINMWFGRDWPFFIFNADKWYLQSSHPESLFWLSSIMLGLFGLVTAGTITFFLLLALGLKHFDMFEDFKLGIAVLFALLIMGVQNIIYKFQTKDDKGSF